jgi:hypothetical protein
MADEQMPLIRVHGFKTTYENLPVKGDPLNEDCDSRGYKLDAKGARVVALQEEHWVTYSPAHSPLNTVNSDRIRHLIPDPDRVGNDQDGVKFRFMQARWAQIEPHYEAFKSGRADVEIVGTPLGTWPGVIPEQVDILRASGIRSVEDVAALTESQIDRVRLPNMRDLRKQARLFLENSSAAAAAEREAKKDAMLEAMAEKLAAMEQLLEEKTAPPQEDRPRRGRPPKVELVEAVEDAA